MYTLGHVLETLLGGAEHPAATSLRPLVAWARSIVVQHVGIDSRQMRPGSLFVALKGERTDGHNYAAAAFDAGAVAALIERPIDCALLIDISTGIAVGDQKTPVAILVPDALQALQRLAAARRRAEGSLRVVGVTGSVGKTTTKEAIAAVLSQRHPTLKSEGNYNNEIGLPLTLMQLEAHAYAVLEMGMYALGEIALLCDIARPQVGVVTNVGPTHLERLGSIERIAQAKSELIAALPPEGVAILNGDDPRVRAMAAWSAAPVVTYGLGPEHMVGATDIVARGLAGIEFRVRLREAPLGADDSLVALGDLPPERLLRTPMLGRPAAYSAVAAVAVGLVEGLSWDEIQEGLWAVGRGIRLVPLSGVRSTTLLDDTYNASPPSVEAALRVLATLPGRHVAVLGDMLELGAYEREGHLEVGRYAATVADLLLTVGERARQIAEGAIQGGLAADRITVLPDTESAIEALADVLCEGDVVLIKGSRGMAMEAIVHAFKAEA